MSSTLTMKNWAIKIADIEELPKYFKPGAEDLLKHYEGEPSIIYAPSKDHNDAVLIMLDQDVVVLEKQEEKVIMTRYPMEEVQFVQMGSVLLDSWLKICGKTAARYSCDTVYFNTVMDALFEPVLDTLRQKMLHITDTVATADTDQLADMKDIDLKFFNYGTRGLLPGQRVLANAYQPGVKLSFWKRASGRETEPHLVVLTEEELIIIKETAEKKKSTTQKYSGIWTHIPLIKINTIDLAPLDDSWGELTIKMEGQKDLTLHYQADHMEKAQHLIETLISQKRQSE